MFMTILAPILLVFVNYVYMFYYYVLKEENKI